ncbi:MAG: hypothetical protein ABIF71_10450 [Planctomycetota bacterium]
MRDLRPALTGLVFALLAGTVLVTALRRPAPAHAPAPAAPAPAGTITRVAAPSAWTGGRVVIEAEACLRLEPPVTITADSTASGGRCLEIREGAGKPPAVGGLAVCPFTVPADGVYRLWGRRWWMDACGNSLELAIRGTGPAVIVGGTADGRPADQPHLFGDDASYNPDLGLPWIWTRGARYRLAAGAYTLAIANREDGVKLDQVLLAEERGDLPSYTPVDIETAPATPAP